MSLKASSIADRKEADFADDYADLFWPFWFSLGNKVRTILSSGQLEV